MATAAKLEPELSAAATVAEAARLERVRSLREQKLKALDWNLAQAQILNDIQRNAELSRQVGEEWDGTVGDGFDGT